MPHPACSADRGVCQYFHQDRVAGLVHHVCEHHEGVCGLWSCAATAAGGLHSRSGPCTQVALLDVLTLTRTGCATPLTFYDSLEITLAAFVGGSLIGFVGLIYMDARTRRKNREVHEAAAAAMQRAMSSPTAGRIALTATRSRSTRGSRGNALRLHPSRASSGSDAVAAGGGAGAGTSAGGDGGKQAEAGAGAGTRPVKQRRGSVLDTLMTAREMPRSFKKMHWGQVFKSLALFWTLCYPGSYPIVCRTRGPYLTPCLTAGTRH